MNCSIVMSSAAFWMPLPATFPRMSRRPNSLSTSAYTRSIWSYFDTSQVTGMARWPSAESVCAVASLPAVFRSSSTTFAPFSAKTVAIACPMPAAVPETIATRSVKSNIFMTVIFFF